LNTWRGSRTMFTSVIHHYAKDPTVWIDGAYWQHLNPESYPPSWEWIQTAAWCTHYLRFLICSWAALCLLMNWGGTTQIASKQSPAHEQEGDLRWRVSLAAEWVHSLEWLQNTGVGGIAPSSKRVREPYCSDSWANKVQLMNDWNEHSPSSSLALWFITCGVIS